MRDFLELLDGVKPAHFVAEAITAVLRTEPPVVFGPAGVADLVADWAEERAAGTEAPLSDLMLAATRTIVDAYNIHAIANFRPRAFYREYRAQLVARCPEGERAILESALDALQSKQPQRSQLLSASELARVAADAPRRASGDATEREFDEALDRLRERPHLPEPEFESAIASVSKLLCDPERAASQPALVRAIETATEVFNGAAVARAGRLFEIVDCALAHPSIADVRRRDARGGARRHSLDDDLLVKWVGDARRRPEVASIVRFFDDFAPQHLLQLLFSEEAAKSKSQTQLLLNLLDARGAEVVDPVIAQFARGEAAGGARLTGLVALLARHGTTSDASRRQAVELVGPLLTSDDAATRAASLAALERLHGREVVPYALRALEPDAYRTDPSGDDLAAHLGRVMSLLVASHVEPAVAIVAEIATGEREVEVGKLGKGLRDAAIDALSRRDGPLPRRAALVVEKALRARARRRFAIITGSLGLGVDAEACLRLLRLVEDSTEPEVRQTLELPKLRKLSKVRSP